MWKRLIAYVVAPLVLAAIAVITLVWRAGGVGESGVEAWVGGQLQAAIASRGTFTLAFDSLDYQYPKRILVTNLRLDRTGVSTTQPGKPAIDIASATIDLAEIPRKGKPIVIESIDVTQPVVHIDAFKKPRATTSPSTRPDLSSIVTLRHVVLHDGQIDYDDGSGNPLSWAGLDADLTIDPADAAWHRVKLAIDQLPLLSVHADGEIDLDQLAIRNLALSARINLNDPAGVKFFTAPMQRWLEKYEVRGECALTIHGNANWSKPADHALSADLKFTNGNAATNVYRFAIDELTATANLRGTLATIDTLQAKALDGVVRGDAKFQLDRDKTIDGQLLAQGLQLEKLVKKADEARKTLAGEMEAHVVFHTTAPDAKRLRTPEGETIEWGTGFIRVSKGRLVNLPVIGDLIAATRKVTNLVTGGASYRDSFNATFRLVGKRFDCAELAYSGDVIAIRGKGSFAFNGDVDLAVNAGPLEKLQNELGPIGELWGKLSDGVMTYLVTGKLKDPEVKAVLGK